jgi:hypothetical protein
MRETWKSWKRGGLVRLGSPLLPEHLDDTRGALIDSRLAEKLLREALSATEERLEGGEELDRQAPRSAGLDEPPVSGSDDARSHLRRTFRMLSEYRTEVAQYDGFLKEKGLREEYAAWADCVDAGTATDASSEEA